MRSRAEISINMPSEARTTSTGNSNRSIPSRRMKSSDNTSDPMAPASASAFMKRPKASSTKDPLQITALP